MTRSLREGDAPPTPIADMLHADEERGRAMAEAVSDEACEEIRRLWQTTAMRQGEIAKAVGLHVFTVSNLIRRMKWEKMVAVCEEDGASPAAIAAVAAAARAVPAMRTSAPARRLRKRRRVRSIRSRVMQLVDRNLDFVEQQMEDTEAMKLPTQIERLSKTLETSARMLDKLNEKAPHDERAAANAGDRSKPWSAAELERRRHEIAARLEQILAEEDAAEGTEPASG